jgi:hypothetical protein
MRLRLARLCSKIFLAPLLRIALRHELSQRDDSPIVTDDLVHDDDALQLRQFGAGFERLVELLLCRHEKRTCAGMLQHVRYLRGGQRRIHRHILHPGT